MSWIYGFFMAWGMFLAIPCPVKIWKEEARGKQLACFPLIGFIVGGLWILMDLVTAKLPLPLRAVCMAALPHLATGFIHLDGFMDVCDAVLSRRDLETRQKILKDSHCGAFAVICLGLLFLTQWSAFQSAQTVSRLTLLCIPVSSRACGAMAVMLLKPMGSSQYAKLPKSGCVVLPCVLLAVSVILPIILAGSFAPLSCAAVYWLCCAYGVRQLGGMSGDISGFSLTLGELAGVLILVLVG